jgi:hypothetical protein
MFLRQIQQALTHHLLFVGEAKIVEQRHLNSFSAFPWVAFSAARGHLTQPAHMLSSENC